MDAGDSSFVIEKPRDYHTVHIEKNSLEKFSTGNSYFDFNNFPHAQDDNILFFASLNLCHANIAIYIQYITHLPHSTGQGLYMYQYIQTI